MSLIHNDTLPGVNQFDTVISRSRKVYSYLTGYYYMGDSYHTLPSDPVTSADIPPE